MQSPSFGKKLLFLIPGVLLLFINYYAALGYLILMNAYFIYLQYFASEEVDEEQHSEKA